MIGVQSENLSVPKDKERMDLGMEYTKIYSLKEATDDAMELVDLGVLPRRKIYDLRNGGFLMATPMSFMVSYKNEDGEDVIGVKNKEELTELSQKEKEPEEIDMSMKAVMKRAFEVQSNLTGAGDQRLYEINDGSCLMVTSQSVNLYSQGQEPKTFSEAEVRELAGK